MALAVTFSYKFMVNSLGNELFSGASSSTGTVVEWSTPRHPPELDVMLPGGEKTPAVENE